MPSDIKPDPDPINVVVEGTPWSLIFGSDPTVPSKQAIWMFNQTDGELWQLIANNNFVLRPRKPDAAKE